MAWSISHSPEAWTLFLIGLELQSKTWLLNAIKEANRQIRDGWSNYGLEGPPAPIYKSHIKILDIENLAYIALEQTEIHMTCSNGGHEFYIDPQGFYSINLSGVEKYLLKKLKKRALKEAGRGHRFGKTWHEEHGTRSGHFTNDCLRCGKELDICLDPLDRESPEPGWVSGSGLEPCLDAKS